MILFISKPYEGTAHDYPIVQMEFPPSLDWFAKFEVLVDLGFQGFRKKYNALKVRIPNKKPRNGELSEAQKEENRELSQERIVVEQSLAGLKRYRILSDRLRMHDLESYSEIIGICAGLWNFNLLYISD